MSTLEIVGGPRDGQRTQFLGMAFVEPYRVDGVWGRRRYELEKNGESFVYVLVSDEPEREQ